MSTTAGIHIAGDVPGSMHVRVVAVESVGRRAPLQSYSSVSPARNWPLTSIKDSEKKGWGVGGASQTKHN